MAAAAFLSQQMPATPIVAAAASHQAASHQAVLDAAYTPGMSSAQRAVAIRQAQLTAMRRAWQSKSQAPAFPTTYTVKSGDSLSAIAGRVYHNADAWPVLYWRNHDQIRWADDIQIGQVLRVPAEPATIPAPPAQLAPPAPPAITTTAAFRPKHASTAPVQAQSAPAPAAQSAPAPAAPAPAGSSDGPWPGGAFGNCVVERESGGNPNVMNASGHYGLYQFSASTWAEYGGNPADFGNASVAEQEAVFMNALARGGEFNWAPYDGC